MGTIRKKEDATILHCPFHKRMQYFLIKTTLSFCISVAWQKTAHKLSDIEFLEYYISRGIFGQVNGNSAGTPSFPLSPRCLVLQSRVEDISEKNNLARRLRGSSYLPTWQEEHNWQFCSCDTRVYSMTTYLTAKEKSMQRLSAWAICQIPWQFGREAFHLSEYTPGNVISAQRESYQ